MLGKIRKI